MKPTSMNVFLQVAKNIEVTRGKIWIVWRMFNCLPAKSLKFIPHQIGSILGRFDFMASRSTLSHQETNHSYLLFFSCLHFQCWTNTLYITLTSRAIKKQLCGPVRFHYACLLLYRLQYRYLTTMLPAFAKNVFFGWCSVFIWLPLIGILNIIIT